MNYDFFRPSSLLITAQLRLSLWSTCLISFGIVSALCSLAILDGISRPPSCIATGLFAG
uniref:hypothetical protein n=1 Tax=Prevotella sp. TaxID=59823 RepID=UPI004024D487